MHGVLFESALKIAFKMHLDMNFRANDRLKRNNTIKACLIKSNIIFIVIVH